jgi:hypothetical protein
MTKVMIRDLLGKLAECDLCHTPGLVEAPRHSPTTLGQFGRGPVTFGMIPVEVPLGAAVVPRPIHYILACPRCGRRSLPEHTPLVPVPDPQEVSP